MPEASGVPMSTAAGVELGRTAIREAAKAFDRPIIDNTVRGVFVEQVVALALGAPWRTTADWDGWDIEQPEQGWRIEVKNSAARQIWHSPSAASRPCRPTFDIEPRTGRYEGESWIQEPGRAAQVYVFAWHGGVDPVTTDHRDVFQWEFFVARAIDLPNQKSISLEPLRKRFKAVRFNDLRATVERHFELGGQPDPLVTRPRRV